MQNLRREGGQVQFDIVYGGLAYDPQYHFVPAGVSRGLFSIEDGLLHFKRLPLFPLLERPFFMLAGWYGLYLLPALAGALISGLTWLLAPTKRSGLVSWLFVALASPVWIYASLFWEHTLASFLVLAGCWLVLRQHGAEGTTVSGTATLSWQTGALAGLLMAAGAFLRLEVGIFALAFWGSICLAVSGALVAFGLGARHSDSGFAVVHSAAPFIFGAVFAGECHLSVTAARLFAVGRLAGCAGFIYRPLCR
ncbi:MAG: hypothetical protein IPJ94_10485 [Chloroflexi bacterium]|nr:hypothetical protein [Chloroflexota bacterium]